MNIISDDNTLSKKDIGSPTFNEVHSQISKKYGKDFKIPELPGQLADLLVDDSARYEAHNMLSQNTESKFSFKGA